MHQIGSSFPGFWVDASYRKQPPTARGSSTSVQEVDGDDEVKLTIGDLVRSATGTGAALMFCRVVNCVASGLWN